MLFGSEFVPTADLACFPRFPKTSTIRFEKPFITSGCWVNSDVQLTSPNTFTTRFTLFKSPRYPFKVDNKDMPTNLAAA